MSDNPMLDEGDEDVASLMKVLADATGKTLPPAAFMRQVRDAVTYHYEGGQYPDDMPDSVGKYLEPDGGLLQTLDLAILLLDEREFVTRDASLIDQVARLLDRQTGPPYADGRWDEPAPEGWESQEALRQAYREMAMEVLTLVIPPLMQAFAEKSAHQLLPQFREIVGRYRGPVDE